MNRGMKLSVLVLALLTVAGFYLNLSFAEPRFNPSENPAYIPQGGDSFGFYIEENRRRIDQSLRDYYFNRSDEPFGAYSQEEVLNMRSPYQIDPSAARCEAALANESKGFLLVHGLSDSPYLLKQLATSLAEAYPCALIRGLLNAGHSTVPGDLLKVRGEDWYRTFEYGIDSFANQVDSLFVVGYSNGSALALKYADQNRDAQTLSGLILLSPGLETRDRRAFLSPWLKIFLPWINRNDDLDAVKYESFATNAAAEFYHLTQEISPGKVEPLELPVLMVVSGDDTTINNQATVDFFCSSIAAESRKMIWYQSSINPDQPVNPCEGLKVVSAIQSDRFVSYSHVSITIPQSDPHYGLDGSYSACLTYYQQPEAFKRCNEDDEATVYAENNYLDETARYQGQLVRRTSFNPAYAEMMEELVCFINNDCISEE